MKISLQRSHALMVEDGAFSQKRLCYNFSGDSKYRGAFKLHYWLKNYSNFSVWVDIAYWWSFIAGGSAINRATPSSL